MQQKTMKCISVQQPWAWAIIHAGKDVENRTWPTSHRGPLLIHTGATSRYADHFGRFIPDCVPGLTHHYNTLTFFPERNELPFGAIIGMVDLIDCVHFNRLPRVGRNPWAEGPYCWFFSNPRPLGPIPYKGERGLFDVDELKLEVTSE